jgi:hypothetical protein
MSDFQDGNFGGQKVGQIVKKKKKMWQASFSEIAPAVTKYALLTDDNDRQHIIA